MAKWLKRIPNWLTLLRVALIPIFVVLLIDPSPWMLRSAVVVFIFAALTDYLDGFVARRYSAVSDFGKLLDPLADKILVMAALVMLVALRDDRFGDSFVPAWMVVLVLAREIWVTGMRGIAATQGTVIAANSSGKVKSVLQVIAIVLLLIHDYPFSVIGIRLSYQFVGLNLLLLSIVLSYIGAYEYTVQTFFPRSSGANSISIKGAISGLLNLGGDKADTVSDKEVEK